MFSTSGRVAAEPQRVRNLCIPVSSEWQSWGRRLPSGLAREPTGFHLPPQLTEEKRKVLCLVLSRFSRVQLFAALWTIIHQAPLSIGFSYGYPIGKNTGVGYHALLQGIFPAQGLNPWLMSTALTGRFFTISSTWEAQKVLRCFIQVFLEHLLLARTGLFIGENLQFNSWALRRS